MNYLQRTRLKINKYLKKWQRAATPDYRLVKCFEHKGVNLYKFENILNLPLARYSQVAQAVEGFKTIKIAESDYDKYQDMLSEYNAKEMRTEIDIVVNLVKAYREKEFNHSIVFSMASPLILLEDEDPEKPSYEYDKRKMELYQHDEKFRGFFLRMGLIYLASYSLTSIGHTRIEDYLNTKQMRKLESLFLQLITNSTSKHSTKRETMKSTD